MLVREAHDRFASVRDGELSDVYPALCEADPHAFGVALVGTDGATWEAGEAHVEFTIMSVAKPFTFALAVDAVGLDAARESLGVNATGLPFNSIAAVEASSDGRTNPMVNPGAIATVAMLPGDDAGARWEALRDGLSAFAGRALHLDGAVHASAAATNFGNRALGELLRSRGRLATEPDDAVDVYTRQSCLRVSAMDLAVMGATLADGGVNPITHERVATVGACRAALAVMTTAGLYETSGDWLLDVGLPGKSGIGGGMVTVSPGKGGLGTYSAPLDPAGNSVRGQLVARHLSRALGLDLFRSEPA